MQRFLRLQSPSKRGEVLTIIGYCSPIFDLCESNTQKRISRLIGSPMGFDKAMRTQC